MMPENLNDRRLRYLSFTQPRALELSRWGVNNETLSFLSDTENIVFRAETAEQAYTVRVSPADGRSVPEIMGELAWLSALRENSDLIVPRPVPSLTGPFVLEATVDGRVYHVVLFEWVEGDVIGDRLDQRSARSIGRAMASLHTHAATFQLPAGTCRDDDDWPGMGDLLVGLPDESVARMEAFLMAEQIDLCQRGAKRAAELISTVDSGHGYGLIHSDLHAWNALMDGNGRVAIIDFDDCQIAPFTCDLAISMSSFEQFGQKEVLETAFLEGYVETRALPPNHAPAIEGFRLERRLRLLRWVFSWPHVDHFPNGRHIVAGSLAYMNNIGL